MKRTFVMLSIGFTVLLLAAGCRPGPGKVQPSAAVAPSGAVCETIPSAPAATEPEPGPAVAAQPERTRESEASNQRADSSQAQPDKPGEKPKPKESAGPVKPASLPRMWDFGAETCIPCKTMMGILNPMMQEFAGRVDIRIINIYQEQVLAGQYRIQIIPTQVFMDATGKELYRHVGVFPRDSILLKFKEFAFTK